MIFTPSFFWFFHMIDINFKPFSRAKQKSRLFRLSEFNDLDDNPTGSSEKTKIKLEEEKLYRHELLQGETEYENL